ncbi:MAG TPA: S-adenosylmethionine:tRNA ribosyltransferase-isomerase, partial [Myxococcota bacterium]|nr:S-adenosylmethionine:tRNA ribosyltransferase-isomerase [Myxococcota bacterium]
MSTPEPQLSDYTFDLPQELIAQRPPEDRAGSRLLLLERASMTRRDARVLDLPELVRGDELLVFNNTRVVPARLLGHKESGGKVELLALEPTAHGFLAMGRASKGFTAGTAVHLERGGL